MPHFALVCCFNFYVFGRVVKFPDLGEVAFYRRRPVSSNSAISLIRTISFSGAPCVGLHGPFCCGRLTPVNVLLGMAGPQGSWLTGSACVEAAGGQGQVIRQLAAGPWGGSRASASPLVGRARSLGDGCRAMGSAYWRAGSIPDMSGCGVWGVPELMLAHW